MSVGIGRPFRSLRLLQFFSSQDPGKKVCRAFARHRIVPPKYSHDTVTVFIPVPGTVLPRYITIIQHFLTVITKAYIFFFSYNFSFIPFQLFISRSHFILLPTMSPRENDDSKHAAITTPTPTPTRTSSLSASSSSVVDFTRRDSVETMLLRHEPCDDDEHCMRPSDLLELRLLDGNDVCIDCGRADPEWACTSLGIFLCLACSGQHR